MPKRNRHLAARALAAFVVVLTSAHLTPASARPSPPLPPVDVVSHPVPPVPAASSTSTDWVKLGHDIELARFYEWASHQPPPAPPVAHHRSMPRAAVVYGSGACGGDLPPCSVLTCESHGNLVAQNPRSTASGKWQILDSTWAGFDGFARAMDAPEDVQDARAREIYAGGAGRRQWSC